MSAMDGIAGAALRRYSQCGWIRREGSTLLRRRQLLQSVAPTGGGLRAAHAFARETSLFTTATSDSNFQIRASSTAFSNTAAIACHVAAYRFAESQPVAHCCAVV
jgi:hypothetical protein